MPTTHGIGAKKPTVLHGTFKDENELSKFNERLVLIELGSPAQSQTPKRILSGGGLYVAYYFIDDVRTILEEAFSKTGLLVDWVDKVDIIK